LQSNVNLTNMHERNNRMPMLISRDGQYKFVFILLQNELSQTEASLWPIVKDSITHVCRTDGVIDRWLLPDICYPRRFASCHDCRFYANWTTEKAELDSDDQSVV